MMTASEPALGVRVDMAGSFGGTVRSDSGVDSGVADSSRANKPTRPCTWFISLRFMNLPAVDLASPQMRQDGHGQSDRGWPASCRMPAVLSPNGAFRRLPRPRRTTAGPSCRSSRRTSPVRIVMPRQAGRRNPVFVLGALVQRVLRRSMIRFNAL